jgi:hypothetical protein
VDFLLHWLLVISSSGLPLLQSLSLPEDTKAILEVKLRVFFSTFVSRSTSRALKALHSFATSRQLQGLPTIVINVIIPAIQENLLLQTDYLGILEQMDMLFSQFLQQDSSSYTFPEYSIREENANQTLKALIDLITWQLEKDSQFELHLKELLISCLDLVEIELAKEMLKVTPSAIGIGDVVEANGGYVGSKSGNLCNLRDYLRAILAL